MGVRIYFWRSNDWWLTSGSNWVATSDKTGLATSGQGWSFLARKLLHPPENNQKTDVETIPLSSYMGGPWSHNHHATKRLGFPSRNEYCGYARNCHFVSVFSPLQSRKWPLLNRTKTLQRVISTKNPWDFANKIPTGYFWKLPQASSPSSVPKKQ